MPNQQFSVLSDGTNSYDVKDASARSDISALDTKVNNLKVEDLADTNISSPQGGQSLVYDAENDEWINSAGVSREWVGTTAELAEAIAQGEIDNDTNILVTNDYTPGGGGGALSHLLINSAAGSTITVLKPDGVTSVTPTQVSGSTTQWECDVEAFGNYTISIVLGSSTFTNVFNISVVGVYIITYDSVEGDWLVKLSCTLNTLSDIDVDGALDGQVLKYNSTTHKWESGEPGTSGLLPQLTIIAPTGSSVSVTDGSQTIIPIPVTGSTTDWACELPSYGTWTVSVTLNGTPHTHNIVVNSVEYYTVTYDSSDDSWLLKRSASISTLSDTNLSSDLAEAQILLYNNTSSKWENDGKISPTPSSTAPTESAIQTAVNAATGSSKQIPSLWGIQNWSNTMTKRVVYSSTIASGATGIGTWQDTLNNPTAEDEAGWGWWYDAHFVGLDTLGDSYSMEFKFEPQPDGDIVTLGGYILDTTTGYLCIKFGAPTTTNTNKIAVDITIVRNNIS